MRITKLQKEALLEKQKVRIKVEITVDERELAGLGYQGFDLLPDHAIPNMLMSVAKHYEKSLKKKGQK